MKIYFKNCHVTCKKRESINEYRNLKKYEARNQKDTDDNCQTSLAENWWHISGGLFALEFMSENLKI